MHYKGYVGHVEFDADTKSLHGRVIGIRDVVTFEADAAADVEREFRASVDDYLAFCEERGERPDRPASGKFVLRVAPELHQRATTVAEAEGTSLNAMVEGLLSAAIDQKFAPRPTQRPSARRRAKRPA